MQQDRDLVYLEELFAAGRAFTYRRARTTAVDDPTWELSKEKWTEWLAQADMAVQTYAKAGSKAFDLMREAKRLESFGEIADDFYRSRESALSALRICVRELRESKHPQWRDGEAHEQPAPGAKEEVLSLDAAREEKPPTSFWDKYGRPITVSVAAAVIAGLLLALIL